MAQLMAGMIHLELSQEDPEGMRSEKINFSFIVEHKTLNIRFLSLKAVSFKKKNSDSHIY